jgi:uncharacterized membrane protein
MNVGQYLLQLTGYAFVATLVPMTAAHLRGARGLQIALGAIVLISAVFYFTMRHRPGTVTPLASTIVVTVAICVVSLIVWRRRSRTSASQRFVTVLVSLLAFHFAWVGAGFALKDWR